MYVQICFHARPVPCFFVRPVPCYFVHAKIVYVYTCTQFVYFVVVFMNAHNLRFRFYLPILAKCFIILSANF